jgi:DNA-binding transcriptional LysR family regulator
MKLQPLLSESEAEVLLYFEKHPSLEAVAQAMGRDPTVISKLLKRISEKVSVLTKQGGRWVLTDQGRRLNQVTRDYLLAQQAVIEKKILIRVGTNREFGVRILSRDIQRFQKFLSPAVISLHLYESGVESALLTGEIDIGFDCGKPFSPEISYKLLANETILPVASPQFIKQHQLNPKIVELTNLPHVFCQRLKPDRVMGANFSEINVEISTNDIGSARELCIEGVGWAMLPQYAIQEELESKKLIVLGRKKYQDERYGVWTMRERKHLLPYFQHACDWLKDVRL